MSRQDLQVVVPAAHFYSDPKNPGSLETEVLFGEQLQLLDRQGEYLQVQSSLYAVPGFVHCDDVKPRLQYITPTHRVKVPYTQVYLTPSFKSGVLCMLSLNAQVRIAARAPSPEGRMLKGDGIGWMFEDQLARIEEYLPDFVEVARSRIGPLPYTWGSRFYPDCSALVMDALLACGFMCPRNVGEQAAQLGEPMEFKLDFSNLQRGDLVFWTDPSTKGRHVVIMVDTKRCVHSTIAAPHRGVLEQDLTEVIDAQERDGNGRPTLVRRLPKYRS